MLHLRCVASLTNEASHPATGTYEKSPLVDRLGSGPRLMGLLGSVVRVGASFHIFTLSATTARRVGANVLSRPGRLPSTDQNVRCYYRHRP